MQVSVIGCGDAFGSGGRFNTCFLLHHGEERALIDCGASSLVALKKQGIDPDTIGTVTITHLHGDHFGGLVFFLREATLMKRRKRALLLAGPEGFVDRLKTAMETFFPGGWIDAPPFGLTLIEYEGEKELVLGPLTVKPFRVRHACGAPPYALRITFGGRTVAYTGDTEWVETLCDLGADADLFICEAYFFSRPINKHLSYETVAARLIDIKPKRLLLTHLNEDMLHRLADVLHDVAEDGMVIDLN
ncbi:MAG TPA: MBL fold metallo-hydrolase [Rhodospirillaceae bacterium]|nr:MBL fold metallo-hydrolase [Magnetovibrio sp.]HCS68775.1 MBL fold metallo-hydrolase [Rhodospirillaceae bacterium]